MVMDYKNGELDNMCDCHTVSSWATKRTKEILRPNDQDGMQYVVSKRRKNKDQIVKSTKLAL